jgi:hypothetical protein
MVGHAPVGLGTTCCGRVRSDAPGFASVWSGEAWVVRFGEASEGEPRGGLGRPGLQWRGAARPGEAGVTPATADLIGRLVVAWPACALLLIGLWCFVSRRRQ